MTTQNDTERRRSSERPSDGGARRDGGPLKVLVVDHDEAAREALANAVRALGHSCRVAVDGLEAWRIHGRDPADVILSDWKMPGMDGIELCRRTRGAPPDRCTQFILVTALDERESFLEGMRAGADDFV